MSSVLEVIGMSLPYSSSTPALYPGSLSCICFICHPDLTLRTQEKLQECFKAAKYLKKLLELDLKPKYAILLLASLFLTIFLLCKPETS